MQVKFGGAVYALEVKIRVRLRCVGEIWGLSTPCRSILGGVYVKFGARLREIWGPSA